MTSRATLRIGERVFSVNARLEVLDEPPPERAPRGDKWTFGPIAVPVDAKLAADIAELAASLRAELYSVHEGPFCSGAPRGNEGMCTWLR